MLAWHSHFSGAASGSRCGVMAGAVMFLALGSLAYAQEPIATTLDGIRSQVAQEREALIGGRVAPVWLEDGNRFLFSRGGRGDLSILLCDPRSHTVRSLTRGPVMREALLAAGARSEDLGEVEIDGLADQGKTLFLRGGESFYAVDLATQRATVSLARQREALLHRPQVISTQFPTTFGDLVEAQSPDGLRFITVRENNLFLRSAVEGALHPLTHDGDDRLTWLNTQESAQSFNILWAPDSARVAAVELDTANVWYEPLPHWLRAHPEFDSVAYPRAGEPMHRFRLAVLAVPSGQRVDIQTGDTTDQYVDLLGWRADGRGLYYQTIDREQKHLRIWAADAASGTVSAILREDSSTYLDTPMTLGPKLFFPLSGSRGFLYLSEADGWRHIYRYDEHGRLVARLTSGQWPVDSIVAVDEQKGWVYFRASTDPKAPYDLQLFRVALQGGAPVRLTQGAGVHNVTFSPSRGYFVDTYSSPHAAPVTELRSAEGGLIQRLDAADASGLDAAGFGGFEELVAPSSDDRWDTHGVLARPYHFDPSRKYPVVEFIYGGMQDTQAPHEFYTVGVNGSNLVMRTLLRMGFVVAMTDAPGTPGRGRAFRDATYGVWPATVIPNHAKWLRAAAATRPWMDLSRVGIYGHSWGGYMAERAMIDAPDLYKVAVAHAAPADFVDHPTYIEPFMGLPQHNPAGYDAGSNLARVAAIQGPILVMPMPLDVNAGFSPGMKFVDAMIKARRDVDLFIVPDNNHSLSCCGVERESYAVAVITRYLRSHL